MTTSYLVDLRLFMIELFRTMKSKSGTSWKLDESSSLSRRSAIPSNPWMSIMNLRKRKVTAQTASLPIRMRRSSRNSFKCHARRKIWVMRTPSASAASAGLLKLPSRIHSSERANAPDLFLRSTFNASQHGYKRANSRKSLRTSALSSGRPSSVKSARQPTL